MLFSNSSSPLLRSVQAEIHLASQRIPYLPDCWCQFSHHQVSRYDQQIDVTSLVHRATRERTIHYSRCNTRCKWRQGTPNDPCNSARLDNEPLQLIEKR